MPRGVYPRKSAEERFWDKVTADPNSGCWLWAASLSRDGYGQFAPKRNALAGAHRYSYELHVGPIPKGLEIDHLCRVRSCVNPDHLEPVTPKENILRGTGLAAVNARKTHCRNGHKLSGENLYVTPDGRRDCRICRRESCRRYRERQREMNCD